MIFLPNFFIRYTSALRCSIQYLSEKGEIKPRHLDMLKKIYKAEALLSDEIIPLDIYSFSSNLLLSIYIKKVNQEKEFNYKVDLYGNYLINFKAYTALVLETAVNSDFIEIKEYNGRIIIKSKCLPMEKSRGLLANLGGYYFKTSGQAAFILPASTTGKRAVKTNNVWDYLANPFSEINLWLQ